MKEELIIKLNHFFDKNPNLKGVPSNDVEIKEAETSLGLVFNKDYTEFIKNFGGAYAGITVHGFKNGSSIGKETVVDLTNMGRKIFNENELFPEINECLIFSDDGSGNPIAIAKDNSVVLFDLDTEEKTTLAKSFEELIENNFSDWE